MYYLITLAEPAENASAESSEALSGRLGSMMPSPTFGYPGDGGLGAQLLAAVLSGTKTATSSLVVQYLSGELLPQVGSRWDLVDEDGQSHGTVETTRVRIIPLDEVGDDVAHDEGEGFADAAEWRAAHETFWSETADIVRADAGDPTWKLRAAEPVVVEWFHLLGRDSDRE